MSAFEKYQNSYSTVKLSRSSDGLLEVQFHTDNGSYQMCHTAHEELADVFRDIADDPLNEAILLRGSGDDWSGPSANTAPKLRYDTNYWSDIFRVGRKVMENYLAIEVPIIAAVNGPARRFAQIPLLADIVLASDTADFQDSAHFANDMVPGDSINTTMLFLLGPNRGRHFLLSGRIIDASEALTLGLVAEVLSNDNLLPRARQLAAELLQRNRLVRRYTRALLIQPIKRWLESDLSLGLALEGLAAIDRTAKLSDQGG